MERYRLERDDAKAAFMAMDSGGRWVHHDTADARIKELEEAVRVEKEKNERLETCIGGNFWRCILNGCGHIMYSHALNHPCGKCGNRAGSGWWTSGTYEDWKAQRIKLDIAAAAVKSQGEKQ